MQVGAVLLCSAARLELRDGAVDVERLRAYTAERLSGTGLVGARGARAEIEYHVRHARLPRPGGERELRTVQSAFNRMAGDLASMERERAMVLAGISHDLRTPLSRLRLSLEMSGASAAAADAIAADVDREAGSATTSRMAAERGRHARVDMAYSQTDTV